MVLSRSELLPCGACSEAYKHDQVHIAQRAKLSTFPTLLSMALSWQGCLGDPPHMPVGLHHPVPAHLGATLIVTRGHPAQVLHSGDLICEGIIKLQAAPEAKKDDAKAKDADEKAAPAAAEAPAAEAAAPSKEAVPEAAAVPVSPLWRSGCSTDAAGAVLLLDLYMQRCQICMR